MSERDDLKARAQELNLEFAANLSTAKLKELIAEAEAQPASGGGDTGEDQDNGGDTSAPGSGGEADTVTPPAGDSEKNPFEGALIQAAMSAGDVTITDAGEATATADATPPEFHGRKFLRVLGPQQGFRRAGRRFGPTPVDIPLDELSEEEQLALKAEPRLITTYHIEGVDK